MELLEKTLRRLKMLHISGEIKSSYVKFGFSDENSLIKAIGSGNITVREILKKIKPKDITKYKSTKISKSSFLIKRKYPQKQNYVDPFTTHNPTETSVAHSLLYSLLP